ncbi:hypothetical protein LCGC14_2096120 [marine sediment metagenome]|uniref:Uncharacterized protein n=1 Tax=marine sediment metagenome TaxID=412755 RepID=A0A0F9EBB6_9ZZZZ
MKWTPIAAIVCIAILEGIALFRGIDGAAFVPVVVALAGLGGYQLKVLRNKRNGGK